MTIPGFTESDFAVFQIDGLEARMQALREQIQPKFAAIGQEIQPFLTTLLQEPVYIHIAKHARRTVHPPDETWVAWAPHKRGYKAHPHFQLGLRNTHLFIWFALIYECDKKKTFARHLLQQMDEIWPNIPRHFYLSLDHTRPEMTAIRDLSTEAVQQILERLERVKKAEFLCGAVIPKDEAVHLNGRELVQRMEATYKSLYPLYQLAFM
ncbi:YktB family protein [Thermoflavimicrobium dichotomicum]|uniref:UPF0637 protein SAMN05421852_10446 n=1 Tax=Thermoflavimicrobium dichotomicum TaxID=46223 RepID=A0A1I3N913_9BACL|nr:DUF1054 domain-containing protein [Thermoflavimicrobium dichotomicum]SFJ05728.1 Uncharacterized protein YktB, UPF0637 family [Thermoflavimicrobium dichotomicum]